LLSDFPNNIRIALVHDWLTVYAGAERVLEQMLNIFPDADLFSLIDFIPAGQRGFIRNKSVTTSFIQKLPKAKTHYRSYLPLMPAAVERFDLSNYDLVLSSSHAVAKGYCAVSCFGGCDFYSAVLDFDFDLLFCISLSFFSYEQINSH